MLASPALRKVTQLTRHRINSGETGGPLLAPVLGHTLAPSPSRLQSPSTMATIEEVYDDPDDLPLPSVAGPSGSGGGGGGSGSRRRGLQGEGMRGALLEEIHEDGDGNSSGDDLDMGRVEEQSRGQGDRLSLPLQRAARSGSRALASAQDDTLRPSAPQGQGPIGPNLLAGAGMGSANPMAGMMSDLMKIQEAEEAKMRKLEAQMGKMGGGAISGGLGRRIALEDTKRCVHGR